MQQRAFVFFLVTMICGCASKPTPYQKEKKDEGYIDTQQENLKISTFKANRHTKPSQARLYAEFRAIENCLEDGYRFANIIDIFDKSVSKEVTKTDSNLYGPSYYGSYGMYPFYSRYSRLGVGVNFSNVSSSSWNETYIYPKIEVLYLCANAIYRPKIMFKEVPAEEMKHLVKDIKGGLQIKSILTGSPNHRTFQENDILLKANDSRLENVFELIQLFNSETESVEVEFLRDGKKRNSKLKAIDISPIAQKAEDKIISQACKEKSIMKLHQDDLCKQYRSTSKD